MFVVIGLYMFYAPVYVYLRKGSGAIDGRNMYACICTFSLAKLRRSHAPQRTGVSVNTGHNVSHNVHPNTLCAQGAAINLRCHSLLWQAT